MLIGVPKEIKDNEFRVGMTPAVVAELLHHGHMVLVEASAGLGSGLTDDEYRAAGATIVSTAAEIFKRAEMIVKVKEPQEAERRMLRSGQVLFTYLHLAPDLRQTEDLIKSGAVCIAYETVTSASGGLPLLAPMSEVAGRLAPQVGAHALEKAAGGRGILLGGVPGAPAADVLIIGGGVSGTHAATIALGMGAHVTILDRSLEVLRRLSDHFERQGPDDLLDPRGDPRMGEEGRSDHRCRACSRRVGAKAHHARNARHDETRRRARRYRDRPGRLCRDLEADDAL